MQTRRGTANERQFGRCRSLAFIRVHSRFMRTAVGLGKGAFHELPFDGTRQRRAGETANSPRMDGKGAERAGEDFEHRFARIPEFGDRVLRVVVNTNVARPRIVTVYFDRRRTGQ